MWTIGLSQRVEDKKYRHIVRKIRYLVFVGKYKKNVTCQTWRALFNFSVHSPFWRVFEKNGFPHCAVILILTNQENFLTFHGISNRITCPYLFRPYSMIILCAGCQATFGLKNIGL